jgi:hypothetical protein
MNSRFFGPCAMSFDNPCEPFILILTCFAMICHLATLSRLIFFTVLSSSLTNAENIKQQVEISARFFDGDDRLSAPRVTTPLGQEATISVGQEGLIGQETKNEEVFSGIILSVTPTVSDGKILLEGYVFVGEGKLEGEDGIKSQAKVVLANLQKGSGDGQRQKKQRSFADQVEMRGMFRLKGKPPRISLQLKDGASFWIELGQTRGGIKLVYVDLSDAESHAILEKDGRFARIDLNTEKVSDIDSLIPLKGGGSVFFKEVIPGKSTNLSLAKPNGEKILVALSVGIVEP